MAATRAATLVGGDGIAGGDVCLVIIDPQNDFHDGGSLAVPGADDDTKRTAAFLEKHADRIDTVLVTLDSHQTRHIANPSFWEKPDDAAARPLPFTGIGSKALADGAWRARDPALRDWAESYVAALEAGGLLRHVLRYHAALRVDHAPDGQPRRLLYTCSGGACRRGAPRSRFGPRRR